MASDNHAHYARIGFVVVAGVIAITATLIYLGGLKGRDGELFLETYSDKPVSGLSIGSSVNFRGVKIGEVRKISFIGTEYDVDGADNQKIYILLAIKQSLMGLREGEDAAETARILIGAGIRATVTASGITGLSRIEIDYPSDRTPPPQPVSWKPEHLLIPPAPSLMDNFSDTATRVMNEIDKMDFETIRGSVNDTMRQSVVAVSNIADLAAGAALLVDSERVRLDAILDDLRIASSSLRSFADQVADDPSLLFFPPRREPLPETRRP